LNKHTELSFSKLKVQQCGEKDMFFNLTQMQQYLSHFLWW